MRKFIFTVIIAAVLCAMHFSGCGSITSVGIARDTVSLDAYRAHSALEFAATATGGSFSVAADACVEVPVAFMSQKEYDHLYGSYMKFLFGGDTVRCTAADVAAKLLSIETNRYFGSDMSDVQSYLGEADSIADNSGDIHIDFIVNCTVPYNRCGVFSACKSCTVDYPGDNASVDNRYFNYDLVNGRVIDCALLFSEENYDDVERLIREALLAQHKAQSEQQLIEMGFFNLDNLSVSNNFIVGDDGITWVYPPLEIGCFALGESRVFVPYAELMPYVNELEQPVPVFNF